MGELPLKLKAYGVCETNLSLETRSRNEPDGCDFAKMTVS